MDSLFGRTYFGSCHGAKNSRIMFRLRTNALMYEENSVYMILSLLLVPLLYSYTTLMYVSALAFSDQKSTTCFDRSQPKRVRAAKGRTW